jgi:hypothetical protein
LSTEGSTSLTSLSSINGVELHTVIDHFAMYFGSQAGYVDIESVISDGGVNSQSHEVSQ